MSNYFSGWHGRRSGRPYFDELPRITIADCKQYAPGLIFFSWQEQAFALKKAIVTAGCLSNVPRLICSHCLRECRVLYFHGEARCYRCTDARYRTTSESPARRAVRAALKVLAKQKLEPGRKYWKPKWQRWPTYERLEAAAEAVAHIITANDCAPYEALARLEASYAAKLNAPKPKRARPPKVKPKAEG